MLWNGNECGKNRSNKNLKKTISSKNCYKSKKLENVGSFKYLGSILTNEVIRTSEIKFRFAMAKAAFNKKKVLFTSTFEFEMRKKLVKCHICIIVLYGSETWTRWSIDQENL